MSQIKRKFIENDAVDNTKLANMPTLTIKGNDTGGSADPKDLTVSEVNALLGVTPLAADVADLVTLSGVAANSVDLGTFTGVTIPDSSTIKAALQSLETAHEEVDQNVNDLITLSGVAENATTLGTFTGTLIPDSSSIKAALQSLETYVDAMVDPFFYAGSYNATTDSPALDNTDVGKNGYVYYVTVAGSQDFGAGAISFEIGDKVVNNGVTWDKWDMTDAVSSVNGSFGAVTVNAINELTGDGTAGPASGSQSKVLTLATVNANVGSFGSSTSIPSFTVNAKGLITAASGNAVIAPAGTLSGTTLNATVVSSSLTSVGTISSGTWNGTTIAIANGGTGQTTANAGFNALSPMTTAGDIIYENATPVAARLGIGSAGQVLTVVGGLPSWQSVAAAVQVTEEHPTLIAGDITVQFIDLLHVAQGSSASVNSVSLSVKGGPEQLKGVDYSVSLTGGVGGVTRINFGSVSDAGLTASDLDPVTGAAALVAGDILMIKYSY